jgi:hypothetical protein
LCAPIAESELKPAPSTSGLRQSNAPGVPGDADPEAADDAGEAVPDQLSLL